MRCPTAAVLILCLALCAGPARAQFQDLIHEVETATLSGDQPLSLTLERVPAAEAVAKLAAAARLDLACAPALAQRKLTLVAHDRPLREVAAGLARAAHARWRKEGRGYLLEPAPVGELLSPQEAVSELRAFYAASGAPPGWQRSGAEQRLLGTLAPAQLEAMQSEDGIPFAQLAPAQQQHLRWLMGAGAAGGLERVPSELARLAELEQAMVTLQIRDPAYTRDEDGLATRLALPVLFVRTQSGGRPLLLLGRPPDAKR